MFPEKKGSAERDWRFLPKPLHLVEINRASDEQDLISLPDQMSKPRQFMKKFLISRFAISRIMVELDRLGINESMIYPDIENQSKYVTRRWATINDDEEIISLPKLNRSIIDNNYRESSKGDYMSKLYGKIDTK